MDPMFWTYFNVVVDVHAYNEIIFKLIMAFAHIYLFMFLFNLIEHNIHDI